MDDNLDDADETNDDAPANDEPLVLACVPTTIPYTFGDQPPQGKRAMESVETALLAFDQRASLTTLSSG